MLTRLAILKQAGRLRQFSSGDVTKGGGSFSKKEHAQEEQYYRKREREELEKYREELKKHNESKTSDANKSDKK